MTPSKLLQAAVLPLWNMGVLLTLVMFCLLLALAGAAGFLGLWLAIVIVPALFRYLTVLVEDVGSGRTPQPPGTEFFRWVGDSWSLFPALVAMLLVGAAYYLPGVIGLLPTLALIGVVGALYPALLGVLSITHSPLQSVNPVAIGRLIDGVGYKYWIAPAYLVVVVTVGYFAQGLPYLVALFVELFMIFSLHTVIGQVMSSNNLFESVDIPDAQELDAAEKAGLAEKARNAALAHAYGFISRGNRDGGIQHIFQTINEAEDGADAWAWFFERMLGWEQQEHALFFAQHYIHDMLRHGEDVPALKVILRCRLVDDAFKPRKDDMPAAIAAAERCGNIDLAAVLKRL